MNFFSTIIEYSSEETTYCMHIYEINCLYLRGLYANTPFMLQICVLRSSIQSVLFALLQLFGWRLMHQALFCQNLANQTITNIHFPYRSLVSLVFTICLSIKCRSIFCRYKNTHVRCVYTKNSLIWFRNYSKYPFQVTVCSALAKTQSITFLFLNYLFIDHFTFGQWTDNGRNPRGKTYIHTHTLVSKRVAEKTKNILFAIIMYHSFIGTDGSREYKYTLHTNQQILYIMCLSVCLYLHWIRWVQNDRQITT